MTGPSRPWALPCLALLLCAAAWAPASAAPQDEPRRTTIYRCDGGATPSYSDTEQRCAGSQVATNPQPSAKPIIGPTTAKLTLNGPPCPLPVPDADGVAWAPVRACYQAALQQQPEQKLGESQLAGMITAQCEAETTALAQSRSHPEILGRTTDTRRTTLRRWALWLVQQSGRGADSMPVQVVRQGKAVTLSHLSGPMELQLPDGQITEALNGSLVRPGDQLYVRKGVGFQLGTQAVPAQSGRERCVRLD